MNRTDHSPLRQADLGGGLPRGRMFAPRSRRRVALPAAIGLAGLIVLPAAYADHLAGARSEPEAEAPQTASAGADVPRGPAGAGDTVAAGTDTAALTDLFGRYGTLDLRLPSPRTILVGYHEASFDDALAIVPLGDMVANDNRTKFEAAAEDPDGPTYVVMSSRGRPRPATSAVDLVLEDGEPVLSPVAGTVTDVRPYHLYGRHPDTRIEIAPTDQPGVRVVLIHVDDVRVRRGDRVDAGVTVLAGTANRFPFSSHIDRFTEPDRWPHVHLEVKSRGG